MKRAASLFVCVLSIISSARPALSEAPNAYFALDGFSFFFAGGVEAGGEVPTISVPVFLSQSSATSWSFAIAPEDLGLPAINLPDGTRVQWTLVSPASGSLVFSDDTVDVSLSGKFDARSLDTTRRSTHTLSFGVGISSITVGGTTVSREGVPMDQSSGYVQLVATASDPPGSQHGVPFYIVLSGRFTGTPAGFLIP